MANRRMFSNSVTDSDAFLDMPTSTQCLYFHLGMSADDDGFVSNPRKIMRAIGCNQNDLDLLIAKSFLIKMEGGVVVIKHWRVNNYIQKDRYKPTEYLELKKILFIKDNQIYTLDCKKGKPLDTDCIQFGYTGKVSIGKSKVSIGKSKSTKNNINEEINKEDCDETEDDIMTMEEMEDFLKNIKIED